MKGTGKATGAALQQLNLRGLDIQAVRRQFGVVLQNGRLMPGSLLDNILGANLHLDHLYHAVLPVLAFVLARAAAKWLACFLVLRGHGLAKLPSATTGLTLVPMAGMAIGLVQSTEALYPEFAAPLSAIVLGAVAVLETVGPISTEWALKRAGEVPAGAQLRH